MTDTTKRDALRQRLRDEIDESNYIVARSNADGAAADVCCKLWYGDRKTLQLLPPDVCTALNAWHESVQAMRPYQTARAGSSSPKPRM